VIWLAWSLSCGLSLALALALRALYRLAARAKHEQLARRSSEQLGAEREQLLATLLDESPFAIVLYADAGRIVFANRFAQRLFFEDQAAEGKNFLRLVESGPAAFRPALLGSRDEIVGFDIAGQRETYHFARRTFAFAGEQHTLLVVRQLTREVARHEIEVLKRVVRLISHEVNNSLGPVSSLIHSARQIVRSGERPERLERVFETVDERAQHLAHFIAGYAALAKLPRPQPRDMEWGALVARLRTLYPEARLTAPEGVRGYFDPVQLEQALINLLKNACEAGGAPDQVSLEVHEVGEGGGAEIQVADAGAGFSADALQHALLPFFTSKPGGSGVGLALVREVADAHGGQLTLGTRPAGGALVTLRLPGRAKLPDPREQARLTLTRG
jgi:two-component system, NtrC family, nitrogen regulation sensor histidine kinase NtrY